MIVVSLLLILVAVTLLVLGLTGGSSTLLISSIVASLLAAVFLVVGARRTAARRRTGAAAPGGDPAGDPFPADVPPAAGMTPSAGVADPVGARRTPRRRREKPAMASAPGDHPRFDQDDVAPAAGGAAHGDDLAHAGSGPADDTFVARPAPAEARSDFSRSDTIRPDADAVDSAADTDPDIGGAATRASTAGDAAGEAGRDDSPTADDTRPGDADDRGTGRRPGGPPAPDYDHASSVIGAARSGEDGDQSWRRAPAAEPEEFGEPDAEDPADEPLPQAVQPGDAVRMARIDAEVLVVDGRPRYHVADCPHLVGRLTEPLPAREAVELGFSPCGLCRPVDRLVAEAVHG